MILGIWLVLEKLAFKDGTENTRVGKGRDLGNNFCRTPLILEV